MKKLLAVLLALLTVLSVTACGNDAETDVETDPETVVTPGTESETDAATESETEPTTETEPETETDPVVPPVDNTFVDRDETVYVVGTSTNLNVRSSPSTADSSNIVGALAEGDSVKRVAYNELWSKIEFNGGIYYASSRYLSTTAPVTSFTDVEEIVYVRVESTINLREKASMSSEILAVLTDRTVLTRTGTTTQTDENGIVWSRVKYEDTKNNKVVEGYVSSSYLTTVAPIPYTDCDETVVVVNCVALHLRALDSRETGSVLHTVVPNTELRRVAIAQKKDDEGILWSMVVYMDQVCYASSAHLILKSELESTETEATTESETETETETGESVAAG